ncbi:hypothetical protein K2173_026265 [Erythroxylum novogranatense]|uniref:Zinc finger protein CONSTANS-LIKE 13 n=1 Tax=Erythroxylum novogranatense TaxID=1862640 RepID=A0AAV8SBM9_9ROSI|nr:hypothetical protein K2173_026265 [Erythroxylum novogranatense]
MKPKQDQQKGRLCDYCNEATALFYCRADSAKLCLACDREVHSTNQLFSKHTRAQLCDACDDAAVSIFCETEHCVLCQNCDWERHGLSSSSSLHNRRPIEGFTEYPSVSELVTVLGLEELGGKKTLLLGEKGDGLLGSEQDGSCLADGYPDLLVWESPAVVSLDELIASSDSDHNFQALGVPPFPKNRNATCGQHKEEILRQLRELASLEPDFSYENGDFHRINVIQSPGSTHQFKGYEHETRLTSFPDYEMQENGFPWLNDTDEAINNTFLSSATLKTNLEENYTVPDKQSDFGGSASNTNDGGEAQTHPFMLSTSLLLPKVASHEINSQERDCAISRYKEKKKTRRYDKHIRYESRKARAEGRTRIKGRFAKTIH